MIQKVTEAILSDTYTQTAALKRLRILRDFMVAKLFKSDTATSLNIPTDDIRWLESQEKKSLRGITAKNIYEILDAAEEEIKKIKPLIIFLPFDAPPSEIEKIGQKIRQTYGENFLIEIKLDPSLIAGAALTWNGVYKDYSLRQRIAENKDEILSHLKETYQKIK